MVSYGKHFPLFFDRGDWSEDTVLPYQARPDGVVVFIKRVLLYNLFFKNYLTRIW